MLDNDKFRMTRSVVKFYRHRSNQFLLFYRRRLLKAAKKKRQQQEDNNILYGLSGAPIESHLITKLR